MWDAQNCKAKKHQRTKGASGAGHLLKPHPLAIQLSRGPCWLPPFLPAGLLRKNRGEEHTAAGGSFIHPPPPSPSKRGQPCFSGCPASCCAIIGPYFVTVSLFFPPLPAAIGSIYLLTWACGETPWWALNYVGCSAGKPYLLLQRNLSPCNCTHWPLLDPALQRKLVLDPPPGGKETINSAAELNLTVATVGTHSQPACSWACAHMHTHQLAHSPFQ